ncbi:MAG: hypothetical protein L0H38_01800 [bacterium]|nr:hypothetical protein [bacterium]
MEPQEINNIAPKQTKVNKRKLTWGLICLIGPTIIFIVGIMMLAVASSLPETGDGTLKTNLNITVYVCTLIAILTWLPGIIVGVILLATRKKRQ